MREIKVRFWDDENEIFIYSDKVYDDVNIGFEKGELKAYIFDVDVPATEFEPGYITSRELEFAGDYTGLQDKNGKDLYEGDVVKHHNGVKEVYYWKEMMAFQMGYSDVVVDQEVGPFDGEDIEIIGNKYENPNLVV